MSICININKKTINKSELLFVFGISTYLIFSFFGYTLLLDVESIEKYRYLSLFFFFCKEIIDKHSKYELIPLFFIVLNIFFKIVNVESGLILFFIMLYSSRNINFSIIIKTYFCVTSLLFIITVLLALSGFIKDFILLDASRVRHCLGFRFPLLCQGFLLSLSLSFIYLKKKSDILICLFLLATNYFFYIYTNARLSFFLFVVFISFFCLKNIIYKKNVVNKLFKIICAYSYIIFSIISYCLNYFYSSDNSLLSLVNEALSNRLYFSKISFDEYGVNFFGQNINMNGYGLDANGNLNQNIVYFYIDNLYQQFLQIKGIVFTILFIFLLTLCSYRAFKKNDIDLLLIHLIIAIHLSVQDSFQLIEFNVFLFQMIDVIYKKVCK